MGFMLELILTCDSCGTEENYGEDMADVPYSDIDLPDGWKTNHQIDDSLFGHVCAECIELAKEEK